jgi:hypothetical protein
MIAVIRIAPFWLFYYWEKPVTGRLGRSSQNGSFIAVISSQERSALALEGYGNWHRDENGRLITDFHTISTIQIPIAFRHTASPCLRPAVSSLGACPTPAR